MSDNIDDVKEFAELTKEEYNYILKDKSLARPTASNSNPSEERAITNMSPGKMSQYTLYGGGYAPMFDTIKTLPAGCYNILSDPKEVYVVPSNPQAGLLLDLPEMRSDVIIKLVENFWNSEKDYKEGNDFVVGGAAYKAGIMIYGPPGSGKSCTIKLLSNKLVERGGTVFDGSFVSPQSVSYILQNFSIIEKNRKSIVILEDIDSLISHYGESAYLSILDSAQSIDNVLFIATTNYPERLDPRIYNRPGRFSQVVKIGLPTPPAREAYLKAILKNHRDVDQIVEKTNGFTIDHLTALVNAVYREKKELSTEIERLRTLFKMPTTKEGSIGIRG